MSLETKIVIVRKKDFPYYLIIFAMLVLSISFFAMTYSMTEAYIKLNYPSRSSTGIINLNKIVMTDNKLYGRYEEAGKDNKSVEVVGKISDKDYANGYVDAKIIDNKAYTSNYSLDFNSKSILTLLGGIFFLFFAIESLRYLFNKEKYLSKLYFSWIKAKNNIFLILWKQ